MPKPGDKVDERQTVEQEDGARYRITRRGIVGGRVQTNIEPLDAER
jgi:uncharacterized protein YjhX (UPF0386 family)